MKQALRKILAKVKRPRSVEQALRLIVVDEIVEQALASSDKRTLIQSVAKISGLSSRQLLGDVGKLLGLEVVFELEIPSRAQIEHWGYTTAALRAASAMPQPSETSPEGFWVVVADLSVLDRKAFEARGIRVLLALDVTIEEAWKRFDNRETQGSTLLSIDKVFAVLTRLVADSLSCGAHEVFLGYPKKNRYEFFAEDRRYSGKLNPRIYTALLSQFREVPKITRKVETNTIEAISVSLTRSFEQPVLCVTWDARGEIGFEKRVVEETLPKRHDSFVVDEQTELRQEEEVRKSVSDQRKSVLLIDDDERFLMILSKILGSKGWEVESCNRATKALTRLTGEHAAPDLIISDIHMPEMDGATFLRKLREAGISVPTLVLTSDDDSLLEVELALLGADAFVRKQEDPRVLLAWCNNLLRKSKISLGAMEVEQGSVGSYLQ